MWRNRGTTVVQVAEGDFFNVSKSRKSIINLTGKINFMVINITQDQIDEWNSDRKTLIQDIFYDLTVDEREFIKLVTHYRTGKLSKKK